MASKIPDQDCRHMLFKMDASFATDKPVETEIVGEVPKWLEGSLYRNGPGIFTVGDVHLKHAFDGFAVLHRFHLHKGKVTYMSRVLDTETWKNSVKANRLVATQFGTFQTPDPCKSVFSRAMTFFKPMEDEEPTDNVSVNIVEHGDRLYALTETPWMIQVNPDTLLTQRREMLAKTIAVHMSTAHPHFDKEGNMYNLATAYNPPNNYNIIKIPPADSPEGEVVVKVQLLASLESRWKFALGYNHSFGMTPNHFVILEQPLRLSTLGFLTNNLRKAAPLDNFKRFPREEVIFRLISRHDNKEVPIKYRAATAFTFHFVNCHEEQGHLVVDFLGYSDFSVMDQLMVDDMSRSGMVNIVLPLFRRYVLPLSVDQAPKGENLVKLRDTTATAVMRRDGTVFLTPDYIVEGGVPMELPKINYDLNASKYRYVYGTRLFSETPQLVKLDLETKQTLTWEDGDYQPGEPVFVPSPQSTAEDDGVILSPVLSTQASKACFLLILDAATFKELGRAVTPQGVRMSSSFHGTYVQTRP